LIERLGQNFTRTLTSKTVSSPRALMRRVRSETAFPALSGGARGLSSSFPCLYDASGPGGARGLSSSSPCLYDASGPPSPFYYVMGGTVARRGREQEPAYRTESKMRRRSPQDRFVRRPPESIEQGSDSGRPTPAPGPITRRVPLDYAQHPRGTPVRVQHEKPGKPPRPAQLQHETRQANINRGLAAWCEQERERALEAEREVAVDSKGGELQGFASTNVAVGGNKSRFGAFAMLSALWMAIHTSLGSWAQRLQSMLKQPAAQLVPGMRAGSARGPQTKLERCKEELRLAKLVIERRKEELRHAENALVQGQLAVLQAEIRVATIAREESGKTKLK